MLALFVLHSLGWMVLIGTLLVLLDRIGAFSSRERYSEETMTRLWGGPVDRGQRQEIGEQS